MDTSPLKLDQVSLSRWDSSGPRGCSERLPPVRAFNPSDGS